MKHLFSFLLTFTILFSFAQNLSISGTVKEKKSNALMEYCTVSLFNEESKLVTGMVTDGNGTFTLSNLKAGNYYLEVSFIGFDKTTIDNIQLTPSSPTINLGVIYLQTDAEQIQEVEVTAVKAAVKYELDKKVVDVDKNIATANGTAADVLATVPSVQADIDGNISLRGSQGFFVLINGRPSVLDANEALQQIPASTIENIEIITNPSARYDAEGTVGIINIITKKTKMNGFSGLFNVRGGIYNTFGGDANLSFKKDKFTFLVSGNYNRRGRPGEYTSELNTLLNDTVVTTINNGEKVQEFNRYNVKAGIEYRPTDQQSILVRYTYGGFKMIFDDELDFRFINQSTGDETQFTNFNTSTRQGPFHEIALDYTYNFKNKSLLSGHISFNKRGFEEEILNDRFDPNNELIFGTRSTEIGPSQRLRINLDYVIPVNDNSKFELGFMQQLSRSDEENIAYNKAIPSGEFIEDSQFYSDVTYKKDIRAFYGIFSSKFDKISYQIGLRTENTIRDINQNNTQTNFLVNRLDFFPSAHFSYNISEKHQFFVSYSKRINRPRGWYLEPNAIYTDANTLWQGNPDILPEYIHAFETGWLYNISKKTTWNNEIYFRREQNVMQFVRVPLDYELTLQFPENVGNSSSLGLESALSLLPVSWWNTDIMVNLFYYDLKGSYKDENFDRNSFSSILRWNNYFKATKNTRFQFNVSYTSPIVNAQGRESYTLRFDAGFKQDLFNKQLSLGLQVGDLFNTYINKSELDGSNFTFSRTNNPRGPSVVASISYKINNYKQIRQQGMGDDDF